MIQYCVVSLPEICLLSENSEDVIKSEISLVHEIALKRNMNVDFKVSKCTQHCFICIHLCILSWSCNVIPSRHCTRLWSVSVYLLLNHAIDVGMFVNCVRSTV